MQEPGSKTLEAGVKSLQSLEVTPETGSVLGAIGQAPRRKARRTRLYLGLVSVAGLCLAVAFMAVAPSRAAAARLKRALAQSVRYAVIEISAVHSDGSLSPIWNGWYSPSSIRKESHYPGLDRRVTVLNKGSMTSHNLETGSWSIRKGDMLKNDLTLQSLLETSLTSWAVELKKGVARFGGVWDVYTVDQEEGKEEFYVGSEDGLVHYAEEWVKDSAINVDVMPGTEHKLIRITYPASIPDSTFELDPPPGVSVTGTQ